MSYDFCKHIDTLEKLYLANEANDDAEVRRYAEEYHSLDNRVEFVQWFQEVVPVPSSESWRDDFAKMRESLSNEA